MAAAEQKEEEKKTEFTSKNLLSDEEILSRGVNKQDIAAYRQQQYNEAYSISKWINIPELKKHTFDTHIIQLSVEEAKSMLVLCRYTQSLHNKNASQLREYESKKQYYDSHITNIKHKITDALSKHEWKHGFFCKLNSRSPKDYYIYRSSEDQKMKELFWKEMDQRLVTQMNLKSTDNITQFRHKITGNNAILSYYKITTNLLKMNNSENVIKVFVESFRILEDLQSSFRCGDKTVDIKLILREFIPKIAEMQIGEFRAFVHNKEMNAITQYFSMIYFEELNDTKYKNKVLNDIITFYETEIKPYILHNSFVIDFLCMNGKVSIIELNPFYAQTGAGLFRWKKDRDLFLNGPLEFRVRTEIDTKLETYFAKKWKLFLDQYKESHNGDNNNQNAKNCILL